MDIRHEDFLFTLCRNSDTLMSHPTVADAVDKLEAEKLYEHLLEQRAWFNQLTSDERDRHDIRGTPEMIHARAALAQLYAFGQVVTPQPING